MRGEVQGGLLVLPEYSSLQLPTGRTPAVRSGIARQPLALSRPPWQHTKLLRTPWSGQRQ